MNAAHCFACAAISLNASLSAEVLIDFGRSDNRSTSASPYYNNLAIGANTGDAFNVTPTFQTVFIADNGGTFSSTSHALADHTGSPSGWSISFQARTQQVTSAGQVRTADTGGDYTGTLGAQSTSQFATTATGDGIYINNSGLLRIMVSGLDPAGRYDLSAFSGRNASATSDGATWTLTAGTTTTARIFLNGSSNPTANTGQWVDSYGANEGDHIEWLGVLPDANGRIQVDIATRDLTANAIAAINALRIATAAPVVPEEADVWLLGGQSNMQGLGKLNELTPAQLTAPADVFYWTGSAFVPLQPGTTQTASGGEFGPEIAFATEIAKRGRKAYIIKYANSGKPLDAGWNDQTWLDDPPAPNRVNFYPGLSSSDLNQGTLYKSNMLPRFQAGIAAITAQGSTPIVRGLAWMQGEQDSKNGTSAGRYAENLKRLRDRLASDLGLASLPLVFGQALPFEPALPRFTHRTEVRAEMALADQDSGSPKAIPLCRMVSTDGFPVLGDTVHYTTAGQINLGTALAEALAELTSKPIHLSFHNLSATADAMNPGTPPSAQGAIVDTANFHWNNLVNPSAHTFTKVPLLSADSSSSAANITGSTGYTGTNANGWSTKNKDSVMMDGWYGFGGTESLSFDNLPGDLAQRYHVIIYGDSNDANRVMNYTINGVTRTIQDSGMFNNTFS